MTPAAKGLLDECCRQQETCTYTHLTFTIWLRRLRLYRNVFLSLQVLFGALATWKVLVQTSPVSAAVFTLLSVVMPLAYRATKIDETIAEYKTIAGEFTNLRDRFRYAATVSAHKDDAAFEKEVRPLFDRIERARQPMLTPPEWCFKIARKKIKDGHYHHDYDEREQQQKN